MPGSPKKEGNGSPLSLGRGGAQIAPKTLPPIGAPAAAPSPGAPSMPGAGSGVLRPASGARKRTAFSVGGEGGGGGGDYEGVRAAQQRLEGKIDEIYRMLRTQKTRDDA